MRYDNVAMLEETLRICESGSYEAAGKTVQLTLTPEEMRAAEVFLPEDIARLEADRPVERRTSGKTNIGVANTDSFVCAKDLIRSAGLKDDQRVLVLNLANAVHPGGGVRRGARAQEEDLCRKSSLLLSLESGAARPYYDYNWSIQSYLGSHAVIINPNVEIIREADGARSEQTTVVSVMTCAAPNLNGGMEGLSDEEYRQMVFDRITGMLRVAAFKGYRNLVLGAFGCGAFSNDAKVVAALFRRAMENFSFAGGTLSDHFDRIVFAVLSPGSDSYNYRRFERVFGVWEEGSGTDR